MKYILSTNLFFKKIKSYFRESWQKTFVTLSRFWLLRRWGVWVNPLKRKICDKNLFQIMLNEVLKSCKNWCKTRNKRTGSCVVKLFTEVPSQYLKHNVKKSCIFNLILVGIPSTLISFVKNRGEGILLNDQNLLKVRGKLFVEDPLWLTFFTWIQSLSQKVNSLSIDVKISCNTRLKFVLVHRTAQLTG